MRVGIKTLGCKVNQYESEAIKENFKKNHHEIVNENEFADVYIINTCTVTSLADRKSRQYIRRMKKINPDSIVAVTGCYAQVSPKEVAAIEAVDIVTGTNQKSKLVELVENYKKTSSSETENVVEEYEQLCEYEETGIITSMESRTRAYIKIQEGCNRFCSYCVIPYARGKVRSRAVSDIIREAESLIAQGFKEITLTGINTALYGTEEGFKEKNPIKEGLQGIEIILDELERLAGDFRVRLSSLEPTVINAEYVEGLLKYKKLCPHLHLSVQSGSNKILKAMNRRYGREDYLDIVRVLRNFDGGYGLTTDIIVGFPEETEEDFKESLDVIEKAEFCKVHVFKYSKREGTRAALMKGHVSFEVKNRRSEEMIAVGNRVSQGFFQDQLNTERTVLIEEYIEEINCLTGYTENYIKAYINCESLSFEKLLNTFVPVKLTELYKDGVLCRLNP
ncbi:tRNA (N(6)-L-threonylcarbamoyladenosine(37)-C(2))-methylthiotransferase MtaB [Aminipila luticellarii]|uniref:Threonylcarbamoyladenosine tRNA methylthiotransferase MtaB n=1 Tax=Aminipila luticellarii TaxID=2507160 RepID=A0A410PV14_9FIRM|nr:tRNA (N(6)-L-threonylcarbamoyladenosine(37)-C(2))-methylthiotransferase MtaB [Aminipila luticellarii]QAT42696.1 tRNA (N(6)-L-threonylcarbamoyladenosine(37)-C(2))-methylthiotransferase MtaB [Aminipila luticellarii]